MIFDNELNKNNILKFDTKGMYGILSENSELMIEYSTCISGTAYTSTFKNSKTQYNYALGKDIRYENIIWLNSIVNKDTNSSLITLPSFYKSNLIQIGSYTNIANPINYTKVKLGNGGFLDLVDFKFSGYLINDGDKLFWSSFGENYTNLGQFYKTSTINITNNEFKNLINKIPKNLNGYKITFKISNNSEISYENDSSNELLIDHFYNGELIIKNLKISDYINCYNNKCNIILSGCNISR